MSENQKISLKTINMQNIFELVYKEGSLLQNEIRDRSGLSGPTVSACLQYFRKVGVFIEGEELASSGGRKPRLIAFNYGFSYAVGIEIRMNHVDIRILNLKGEVVAGNVYRLAFKHEAAYWSQVSKYTEKEIKKNVSRDKVIGIGIAFPGEISLDGQKIVRATVFGLKNVAISDIQRYFKLPITVEYGPNAAGYGITWRNHDIKDCVCIVVTNNGVAGSVINDNKIYRGKNGEAGAFGHFVLDNRHKQCFYGNNDTWSNYCAVSELTGQEDPDLPGFFEKLKAGDKDCENRWQEYITYMARGLATVKLAFDADIVIAGRISPYLNEYYDQLKKEVSSYPFLKDEDIDILIDVTSTSPMAEGAAMIVLTSFLENYINNIYE
ncbi:MAG: ROK family protein [Erysipelotrichaceae bacterium]|nr:ROK family protein [Erysipelotrichaceae bacterium]